MRVAPASGRAPGPRIGLIRRRPAEEIEAMTSEEWAAGADPKVMLAFLVQTGQVSERKGRLFAAACCRQIFHLLPDGRSRRAVEVGESYAGGDSADAPAMVHRAAAAVASEYAEAWPADYALAAAARAAASVAGP